jgi:peptidoglycan/xylan/chitin deacetylase (PgdA/CDA1 family)
MSCAPGWVSRRDFVMNSAAYMAGFVLRSQWLAGSIHNEVAGSLEKGQIAITIDLEMARHYPTWQHTHWDYEKGNLDEATKNYALEAARRVSQKGGRIHFFAVGRVFEQESVDWLKQIVAMGHPIGNHTYDHVNIRASRLEVLQPRFRRAPWLIQGKKPLEVIAENIRMTTLAIKERLGIEPCGFRSPGGFPEGLTGFPEVQQLLLQQGFSWASTRYVSHPTGAPGYSPQFTEERRQDPPPEVYEAILQAQAESQPSVYSSGLIEIPMCPVSDLVAFRTGRWKLPHFLKAIRDVVTQAIDRHAIFVFLGHPSCLSVTDPHFETVELICDLVNQSRSKAQITDLETIALGVKKASQGRSPDFRKQ